MLNRIVFPIVIVMSACSLITASAQSQGIIGPVSTTLALGVVLDQVEEKIDGIIRTAGKEARATIMEASRQMRLVTTHMRIAFADSLDKTFEEISKERQAAFRMLGIL